VPAGGAAMRGVGATTPLNDGRDANSPQIEISSYAPSKLPTEA